MKPKIKTFANQNLSDEKGILASLIFLRGEVRKAELFKTEKVLERAIKALFSDLQTIGKLDENLEMIQSFLQTTLAMNKEELAGFLKLLQFFDETNGGEKPN
jgi:hypothetical protein